jgi:hypothetical protein
MIYGPELLLVGAIGAVGVLHTIVPDHWLPIALIARQRGWSRGETARAALQAGTGHVLSTLAIALVVWVAGVALAQRFGELINALSGIALVGFGGWVALSAWHELHSEKAHRHRHGHDHSNPHHYHQYAHEHPHEHGHHPEGLAEPDPRIAIADDRLYAPLRGDAALLTRHIHVHRHGAGAPHLHWHDHLPATAHPILLGFATAPPLHNHRHRMTARTALLLILGSSPMVEGIPAFFAAGQYGPRLIAPMATVFAASTIATYVALCVWSSAGLQHLRLGVVERYGEVLSGAVIALVGVIFGLWPAL